MSWNLHNQKKGKEGFVAITSVLIITAVIMILGVSLFYSTLTDQAVSVSFDRGLEAASLAGACAREGVSRLKEDINYDGYYYIEEEDRVKIGDGSCYSLEAEDINEYTKKVSSSASVGEWEHVKREEKELRYVLQSSASDWEEWQRDGVAIEGNSLLLEPGGEDTKERTTNTEVKWLDAKEINNLTVTNDVLTLVEVEEGYLPEGTRISNPLSFDSGSYYQSSEITWQEYSGQDTEVKVWAAVSESDEEYPEDWGNEIQSGDSIPGLVEGDDLSDKFLWTKIELSTADNRETPGVAEITETVFLFEEAQGEVGSPIFTIKDYELPGKIKKSQAFWEAKTRIEDYITVETNVFKSGNWLGWEEIKNGGEVPGLEKGTKPLEDASIQTRVSFSGGPEFYPELSSIAFYFEIEESKEDKYVDVEIVSTNTPLDGGDTFDMNVNVENLTGEAKSGDLVFMVDGEEKDSVNLTVAGNDTESKLFSWETTLEDMGNRIVAVSFKGSFDSEIVRIRGEAAYFNVTISNTNSPVVAGETLSVTALIENTGDEAGTKDIVFEVGGQAEGEPQEVSLQGGAEETVSFSWETTAEDEGSHIITVSSDDDSDTEEITVTEETE